MSGRRREAEERPAWWYDPALVHQLAIRARPTLLRHCGYDPGGLLVVDPPFYWPHPLVDEFTWRRHFGEAPRTRLWACFTPYPELQFTLIDWPSGEWWDRTTGEAQDNIESLVALRLRCSKASAAWRIARWAGRREPR